MQPAVDEDALSDITLKLGSEVMTALCLGNKVILGPRSVAIYMARVAQLVNIVNLKWRVYEKSDMSHIVTPIRTLVM